MRPTNGWRTTSLERTLIDLGKVESAGNLQRLMEDAVLTRRTTLSRIEAVFATVSAAFPTDVEFTVRRANHVKMSKGPEAALALLQPLLVAGESSPGRRRESRRIHPRRVASRPGRRQ